MPEKVLKFDDLSNELYSVVTCIQDDDVRKFTLDLLHVAPDSFWYGRASRAHHMIDERGKFGNLLHTIRVARLARMLCEAADHDQTTTDPVISAAVLHDVCRYGLDGLAEYSVKEHPHLVRLLAKQHNISCKRSALIFIMIETHMGKWGTIPHTLCLSSLEVVHVADLTIARFAEVIEHA